jgi:two-component sensor histidine kinase
MESASGRVLAMGQVHQIGSGAATGNLAEVVRSVCTDLLGSDTRIELKIDAEPVIAPVHTATVVALIANELVTNAVKHAFSDRAVGKVAVSLRRTNGALVTLTVADDGAPLPVNGQKISNGMGLDLVSRLAAQLAGKLTWTRSPNGSQ